MIHAAIWLASTLFLISFGLMAIAVVLSGIKWIFTRVREITGMPGCVVLFLCMASAVIYMYLAIT